jgi:UDP-glucose 4-epimerase
MKVFVSGGAGYIGGVAVDQLIEAGEDVVVYDNLSQGHRQAVNPDAILVEGELGDRSSIDAAMVEYRPDAVMHFASNALVGESMAHPFLYLGDNVVNGLNLMQSAVEHGVGRFIVSSTANLFDEPESIPITANERIVPGSPYGESKFFLERILYWLDRTKDLRYAALRYFNVAGATEARGEDHNPETRLIPLTLDVALGKLEKILIYGDDYDTPDGTCIRDYIHVSDVARAHILALHALPQGSRTYNLGNTQGFSVKEVIDAARAVTGHPISAELIERRPGDPDVLIAGSDEIRRDLGWEPQFPDLHSIVDSAWRWRSAHPNGYELNG